MVDRQTWGQLKKPYRARFYQNRGGDLPDVRPGTNVLSAITDYFDEAGAKASPGFSPSSFFADSLTSTPDGILKKQGSSSNPHTFTSACLHPKGNINETKMKASPAVSEQIKNPNYNNININVISEEEMDDCESDMPLDLVEKEKDPDIFRPVSNLIRNRLYSSDNSVVQGPPSPASKSSPKKWLRFSDAVVKNKASDKASFASVFASIYKGGPADDLTTQIPESVRTDSRHNTTTAASAKEDDEEFVIEDEHSINMSFVSVNKRSSVGSSKETKSIASSNTHEDQKPQRKVSQRHSDFYLSRSSQPTKETMMAPPSGVDESQTSKAASEQSLPYSKTIQQTRQTSTDLEMDEIINQVVDASRAYKVPGTPKSKSSCVSYRTLEIEPAEPLLEQSTVQSETMMNTDYSDLPVRAEDEPVVAVTDLCSDAKSNWNKKPQKMSKDGKKKANIVPTEVLNVTYTSVRQNDNVGDSRTCQNDSKDSSFLLKDKKRRKSRPTEVEQLVLQKYVLPDVDNQNEVTSLRSKRTSVPPSPWWVVKQAGWNTTFEIEEELPHNSPKSKRKTSAVSINYLELQSDNEESFELEERNLQDQNEQKESNEKLPNTLTPRKRAKKLKYLESDKATKLNKVKGQKRNKAPKKTRSSAKKSKRQQESDDARSPEHDLNVCDLPNKTDFLAAAAKPTTPPVSEPHCLSRQRHKPSSDECSKKFSGEREPHRVPRQSFTSPVYGSAKLSFQSGPVLKTRAVEHNSETDAIVQNLANAESLNAESLNASPLSVVHDIDTNQDATAECVYRAGMLERMPCPVTMCFNNDYFSAGKCVLKPREEDMREGPIFDVMVFYVVQGQILLKLHKSFHHLKGGDFFYVPPCNNFRIRNNHAEIAELVFIQLKPGS